MSVIWIVEKNKARADSSPISLASCLMGDYAVRAFASLATFETLLRLTRTSRPQLLIIDLEGVNWRAERINDFLAFHFNETPVILVGGDGAPWHSAKNDRVFHLERPADGLHLSIFAGFVMRTCGAENRPMIRYRDIILDYEKRHCLVLPDHEPIVLPFKEAQLLKLLLEKPGVCLSRGDIQTIIWESVKVTPRTIDSHVSRLRKRLQGAEIQIQSVYGGGYVLK